MERFKVCEKETKTKAFSKEGLAKAAKKDPEEIARDQAREALESYVEQIEQQKEVVSHMGLQGSGSCLAIGGVHIFMSCFRPHPN